jgi:CheY-like chemotaxis protein
MTSFPPSTPRLLVVEADQDLREILHRVFVEQGYGPTMAASLEEALRLVHQHPFDLILTELFILPDQETLALVLPLRELAHPTPDVVIATRLSTQEVQQQGFAALLREPFDLNELITTVAECLKHPMSDEQQRQAEIATHGVAALDRRDFDTAFALCTEDVRFYPWIIPPYPAAHRVVGRAALRAYFEEMAGYFHDRHAEIGQFFGCPHGIAVRIHADWRDAYGVHQQQMVALCFQITGEQISQLGVSPGDG